MEHSSSNQILILKNKVAVVTGAGSGIGKRTVERFVKEGAKAVAADMNEESLVKLMEDLSDFAPQARTFKMDVSKCAEVEAMVDFCVSSFGGMDILMNNTGIMVNLLPIAEMDDKTWDRLMSVNLNSVSYGCLKAVRYFLINRREGFIINTVSLSGLCAGHSGGAYTTSKSGVVGVTKNVAFMYGDADIHCNVIRPANTQTNISTGMRQPSKLGMSRATTGYAGATLSGMPEKIADAAVFLASGEANFINGETLTIDGGWSAY